MEESTAASSSSGTRRALNSNHEIRVKRLLINGVKVPMGETTTVTGGRFELAVQMDVIASTGSSSSTGSLMGSVSNQGLPLSEQHANAATSGEQSSTTSTTMTSTGLCSLNVDSAPEQGHDGLNKTN